MHKKVVEIGSKFGKLVVVKNTESYVSPHGFKTPRYLCKCECGNEKVLTSSRLTSGRATSCGCEIKPRKTLTYKNGDRYGMLTIIGPAEATDYRATRVVCKCDCGNTTTVYLQHLKSGATKSCGCLLSVTTGNRSRTHGKSHERLYYVWYDMKDRCYDKTNQSYLNYGGRGITVCDEWKNDYMAFREWAMANGYKPDAPHGECTIDRIDNNKGYSPDNCRWVDMKTQANNKRTDTKSSFEINGVVKTFKGWCDFYGISYNTANGRVYKLGWDKLKAVTTPLVRNIK